MKKSKWLPTTETGGRMLRLLTTGGANEQATFSFMKQMSNVKRKGNIQRKVIKLCTRKSEVSPKSTSNQDKTLSKHNYCMELCIFNNNKLTDFKLFQKFTLFYGVVGRSPTFLKFKEDFAFESGNSSFTLHQWT